MASVLGKMWALPVDELVTDHFSLQFTERISIDRTDVESYSHAACLLELIMLKRGVLYIPLDVFFFFSYYLRHRLSCVCPPSCLYRVSTARLISLGGEGNALYPVLFIFIF